MSDETKLIVRPETTVIRHKAAESSFEEVERMATAMAKSNLFAVKSKEEAVGLMLLCQAEGLHPVDAFRRYHIIKGRPSMRADAMMAEFQARGGRVRWIESTDKRCTAEFSHPAGGTLEVEWDIAMATRAGLLNNPQWQNYPRAMLRARTISEGVRAVLPGVVVGIYTPEEVEDFEPQPEPQPRRDRRPMERERETHVEVDDVQTPGEIIKAALTKHAHRGWVTEGKPDRARLEALKGYLGIVGDATYESAAKIVLHLAMGWEEVKLRIDAEAARADAEAAKPDAEAKPQPEKAKAGRRAEAKQEAEVIDIPAGPRDAGPTTQRDAGRPISRKAEPVEDEVDAPFDFGAL